MLPDFWALVPVASFLAVPFFWSLFLSLSVFSDDLLAVDDPDFFASGFRLAVLAGLFSCFLVSPIPPLPALVSAEANSRLDVLPDDKLPEVMELLPELLVPEFPELLPEFRLVAPIPAGEEDEEAAAESDGFFCSFSIGRDLR